MLHSVLLESSLVVQHQNGIAGGKTETVESLQFFAMLRDRKQGRLVGDDQERSLANPVQKITQEIHEATVMQGVRQNRSGMARP
jgi:hypothetical protein